MPEEKKDEMGVGCVVVARERPTTRDGVVVATTARSWVRSREETTGKTFVRPKHPNCPEQTSLVVSTIALKTKQRVE